MNITRSSTLVLLALLSMFSRPGLGQSVKPSSLSPAPDAALSRWQEMRFGMFIHWGPVSLKGTEIGWSRGREIPAQQYDQLLKEFNPTLFNADQWVDIAKSAGMKYLVITSKHHDGFCIWDSKYTDYDITATPFKRDILAELAPACRKQGLLFCTYHSICDWYHPDYPLGSPGGKTRKPNPNMARYVEFLQHQLSEIVENYGPLGIMWFDGEWESPWTHQMGVDLYGHVRGLQSDILINNRVDKGRQGMEGVTISDEFLGDYDTPEQRVGGFNREQPWESCITICHQWAWKPNDQLKSLKECLQTLLRVCGGDGNLLLNVGPMPDGRIEPRQVERLKEIGAWLDQFGDGVYGTRGGPFKPGNWGASMCKEDKIYLYVMNWPENGPLRLPAIDQVIRSTKTRNGGVAKVTQTQSNIAISLEPADRNEIASIIELTVGAKAFDIQPNNVDGDR